MSSIKFRWEAFDGYLGGSRPQRVAIDESDITDCEDEDELLKFIESAVQDDFEQKVSPGWDDSEVQKLIEIWKELRAQDDS
jgi:hypothetical protein